MLRPESPLREIRPPMWLVHISQFARICFVLSLAPGAVLSRLLGHERFSFSNNIPQVLCAKAPCSKSTPFRTMIPNRYNGHIERRSPRHSAQAPPGSTGLSIISRSSFRGDRPPSEFVVRDARDVTPIRGHLTRAHRNLIGADEAVILVLEVDDLVLEVDVDRDQTALGEVYHMTDERFPKHLVDSVLKKRIRQPFNPGQGGGARGNVAYTMNHRGGTGVFPEEPARVDAIADRELCIGVWVGSRTTIIDEQTRQPMGELLPMVVIVFPKFRGHAHHYARKLRRQYSRQETRSWFHGINGQPMFIFMDLYRMFTDYKSIIEFLEQDVEAAEPDSYTRRSRVIPRVARLHGYLGLLLTYRKELHMHDIARKCMLAILRSNLIVPKAIVNITPSD
ncbi:hypothetical protein BJ170DRAFT_606209 [Xylariales sp. AK1849]|nr:hypothetical protein BJ170DRAFT_606209 [Xylariales sp. AK1849]